MAAAKKAPKKKPELDEDVSSILGAIRKTAGAGAAQILGSSVSSLKLKGVISTQAPSLDLAIGRGGVPMGKLTVLWAGEGVGKTTLTLHLIAEVQKLGGVAMLLDTEHAMDPNYARSIGVKLKRLIFSQPDTLEEVIDVQLAAIDIMKQRRLKTGERRPLLIVLDSVDACIPRRILEGDPDTAQMGIGALLWSQNLPKLKKLADQEGVALVYISQVRSKIGVMFGSPDKMAGGNALKFYSDLTLKAWREKKVKDGEKSVGHKIGIEAVKNKIAPPFQKGAMEVRWGVGINRPASLLEAMVEAGRVVDRSGSLYLDGELIGKGRRAATAWIAERFEELNKQFRVSQGWEEAPSP